MRVAFATDGIFPHSLGGMQRHTAYLAATLARQGVEIDVFAPRGHEQGSYPFRVIPLDWPSGRVYPNVLSRWADRCTQAIASGRYDVVYGQGLTLLGKLPADAPPSIFHPHGLELCTVPGTIDRLKAWPLRIEARRQAHQATSTISLGGRLTDVIVHCLRVPRGRIAVIPNGVEPSHFGETAVRRDEATVLFVGRLAANKGVDVLCRALPLLPPATRIVVAGEGPLESRLRREFPDTRISFTGAVSESRLRDLYGQATVLALPTRSDGMPTVILEAFCCGTPVVATDVGAVAELVSDATGVLLPTADPQTLAQGLRRVLELGADDRLTLGASARRLVETRFSWDAVGTQTLGLLERVAAGSG